jgi:hypothetical protein
MPQKRPDGGGVPSVVERPDCSLAQLGLTLAVKVQARWFRNNWEQ